MDTKRTLTLIANALDVPVSTFLDGATGRRADEAAELLRRFERIEDPAERRAVLDFISNLGERQSRPVTRVARHAAG